MQSGILRLARGRVLVQSGCSEGDLDAPPPAIQQGRLITAESDDPRQKMD